MIMNKPNFLERVFLYPPTSTATTWNPPTTAAAASKQLQQAIEQLQQQMRQAARILTRGRGNFSKDSDHVSLITFLVFLLFLVISKVVENLQLRIRKFWGKQIWVFFSFFFWVAKFSLSHFWRIYFFLQNEKKKNFTKLLWFLRDFLEIKIIKVAISRPRHLLPT